MHGRSTNNKMGEGVAITMLDIRLCEALESLVSGHQGGESVMGKRKHTGVRNEELLES